MPVKQTEGGASKRLARDGAKGKRASEGPAEGIGEGQARGAAGRLKGLVDLGVHEGRSPANCRLDVENN